MHLSQHFQFNLRNNLRLTDNLTNFTFYIRTDLIQINRLTSVFLPWKHHLHKFRMYKTNHIKSDPKISAVHRIKVLSKQLNRFIGNSKVLCQFHLKTNNIDFISLIKRLIVQFISILLINLLEIVLYYNLHFFQDICCFFLILIHLFFITNYTSYEQTHHC